MHPGNVVKALSIEKVVNKGKGLGRRGGKVVFVRNAVPGDVVDVRITKNKRDYAEGQVAVYVKKSPFRQAAFCTHFGLCGGCPWQDIAYDEQLAFKHQIVGDALERTGKLKAAEVQPVIPADKHRFFRNKVEFSFSARGWADNDTVRAGQFKEETPEPALGFHIPGHWDKVLHLNTCYLQEDPSNAIRDAVYAFVRQQGYSFFDIEKKTGLLRSLTIRTTTIGEVMVILSFFEEDRRAQTAILDMLDRAFPELTSLQHVVNPTGNDAFDTLPIHLYKGRDHIIEVLGHCRFRISAKSFFQTNTFQARVLYDQIRKLAGLTGREVVYDLYCGTGSIGIYLADRCSGVVGIEQIPEAVEDARRNAALNAISHATFYTGHVQNMLNPALADRHGRPDVLITNPARAGMSKRAVRHILKLAPPRLIYSSCNPVTQARDIHWMQEDYEVTHIQPVDLFPHTTHIENIVVLEKRDT